MCMGVDASRNHILALGIDYCSPGRSLQVKRVCQHKVSAFWVHMSARSAVSQPRELHVKLLQTRYGLHLDSLMHGLDDAVSD